MARHRRGGRSRGVIVRGVLASLLCLALGQGGAFASTGERVVGIGAAVTEIIYALGAQSRLVGVDSQSIYPPEARALPQVGYVRQLAVEGLASLEPDLIISAQDAGPPQALNQLKSMGIKLELIAPAETIEQTAERIEAVGAALGMQEQGARLAADVRERATVAHRHFAPEADALRPRVAMFLGRGAGSPTGAGAQSVGDAMIRLGGGENAFAGMNGFKPVPAEALIAAAPDVVVVTSMMLDQAGSLDALIASMPGLALTPAAMNRRVVVMDILEMFSFGPRLPDAIAKLGAAIHPERAARFAQLQQ
nr:ABC transporter substrate-binding protein [Zoogloeaceae bacterium]